MKYVIIILVLAAVVFLLISGPENSSPLEKLRAVPQTVMGLVQKIKGAPAQESVAQEEAGAAQEAADSQKFVEITLTEGTRIQGELLSADDGGAHILKVPYAQMTITGADIAEMRDLAGAESSAISEKLEYAAANRAEEKFDMQILERVDAEETAPATAVAAAQPKPAVPVAAGAIPWEKSLTKALPKAKSAGKWVMIDFSTSWCGWCTKLDQDTFQNPQVSALLQEHFICVKLDGDKEKSLMKKYGVRGFPNIVFTDASGTKKHQVNGYLPPQPFMGEVNNVLSGKK